LTEILLSSGLVPGSDKVGQKAQKGRHSQKIRNPQPKYFFIAGLNTWLVFWVKQLSSYAVDAKTCANCWFRLKLPATKVLIFFNCTFVNNPLHI